MIIDLEISVMQYDIACQWCHRAKSIVQCKNLFSSVGGGDQFVDGEVIEQMWINFGRVNGQSSSQAIERRRRERDGRITNT